MLVFAPRWGKTGSWGRRGVVVLAVVLAAVGAWQASLRRPTGPAEGFSIAGQPPGAVSSRGALRVATFNIHSGKGPDGRYDLSRVVKGLQGLDFVALNEVRGWSYADPADQAEALGRGLGLGWLFAPGEQRWFCQQFGNGLLTRAPVRYWQRIPLDCRDDRSHRNLVLAVASHQGRAIRILITHVTRRTEDARRHQLRCVGELFLAMEKPSVLLGDMNSPATDPQMREILAAPGVVDPLREAGVASEHRIDWILARGFRAVAAGIRDEGISDHPLVWAELELVE
ncbi:MAG: endonuclease/exonuclease/phosphatase family protein [Pirellulales bacterium]|nr:endonuclease/exonuclease/phosphatase family protein [Pirellulales bacterium]